MPSSPHHPAEARRERRISALESVLARYGDPAEVADSDLLALLVELRGKRDAAAAAGETAGGTR